MIHSSREKNKQNQTVTGRHIVPWILLQVLQFQRHQLFPRSCGAHHDLRHGAHGPTGQRPNGTTGRYPEKMQQSEDQNAEKNLGSTGRHSENHISKENHGKPISQNQPNRLPSQLCLLLSMLPGGSARLPSTKITKSHPVTDTLWGSLWLPKCPIQKWFGDEDI